MTEKVCAWCKRAGTVRVPVDPAISDGPERCDDADDCIEAAQRRNRDLFLESRGFKPGDYQ